MKRFFSVVILSALLLWSGIAGGAPLEFTVHKLESGKPGPVMLVVGGIQGDEPGGFNAASLLVTDYRITEGSVWVVPNLNFISIIKRSRGVHGDLNRKFAGLKKSDPEFDTIRRIKGLIQDENVDFILNLHDGSGFYREKRIDNLHGPHRWGQCVIVDQEKIQNKKFGDLAAMARTAVADVNRNLLLPSHSYRLRNTRTRDGNKEMAKTLTYFAIKNGKPAFGLEASKSFMTPARTYYHLQLLESFMTQAKIGFTRNFSLTTKGVEETINGNVRLALNNSRILLDVRDARKYLNFIPLPKGSDIEFTPSNPLLTVVGAGRGYGVYHGNRNLTHLIPQYFEYDSSIDAVVMDIDGAEKRVNFGNIVNVDRSFTVQADKGYRVNVIGFKKPHVKDEAGIAIQRKDFQERFSVDRAGHLYRIEVYREKRFSGMVLVDFSGKHRGLSGGRLLSLAGN